MQHRAIFLPAGPGDSFVRTGGDRRGETPETGGKTGGSIVVRSTRLFFDNVVECAVKMPPRRTHVVVSLLRVGTSWRTRRTAGTAASGRGREAGKHAHHLARRGLHDVADFSSDKKHKLN